MQNSHSLLLSSFFSNRLEGTPLPLKLKLIDFFANGTQFKFSLIDFDKQKWIFLIILAKKWKFLPKSATLFGIFDPKKVQD